MKKWLFLGLIVLLVCILLPMGAGAAGANTNVTANVVQVLDLQTNGSISNWQLAVGDNYNTSAALAVNSTGDWAVTAQDAQDFGKTTGIGYLANWTGSAWGIGNLSTPLQVKTTANGTYISLTGTAQGLDTGGAKSAYYDQMTFWQHVNYGDTLLKGSNIYRIMVQFTGNLM